MRKFNIFIFVVLIVVFGFVMVVGFIVEQGKNFINLNMEMGKFFFGLYVESYWLKNIDDGSQIGGVGVGYNLEVGLVMFNVGVKVIYFGLKKGDNGVVFLVGGGVNVILIDSIYVFGEGYVVLDGLNNSVKNYVEVNGGVSWFLIGLVMLKVGYCYVSVDGKEGCLNYILIDGVYVGGGVIF